MITQQERPRVVQHAYGTLLGICDKPETVSTVAPLNPAYADAAGCRASYRGLAYYDQFEPLLNRQSRRLIW
jgi:hypothetical protein